MKLKSFEELGKYCKVKPKAKNPEKPRKCNKCGGNLHLIAGTNVYVCDGVDAKTKRPYEHKVLTRKPAVV